MILTFGRIDVDIVVPVPRLPRPGETILGSDDRLLPSGKDATRALAARHPTGSMPDPKDRFNKYAVRR
jgi:ribokinase